MRYEKPTLVAIDVATAVIKGGNKGSSHTTDMSFKETVGAYEADE